MSQQVEHEQQSTTVAKPQPQVTHAPSTTVKVAQPAPVKTVPRPVFRKTTEQVLRELPDSATPWQQDSAVQAYFKPGQDNHYSDRPDTLGLPGRHVDKLYMRKPFSAFSSPQQLSDTILPLHTQVSGSRRDAAPAPYRVGADSSVSLILVMGALIALMALAASVKFVMRQGKNFFYRENARTTTVPDTVRELRSQGVLVVFTGLLLAVFCFHYSLHWQGGEYFVRSKYILLAVYLLIVFGYLLLKVGLYQFVNWVFFDSKKNEQWNKSMLFLYAMEGVALTPIVLLSVYGPLRVIPALICIGIVVLLAKILSFYKCYLIFFRQFGAFLQIFLYFCALELIPLAGLVGILETFNENLIINF